MILFTTPFSLEADAPSPLVSLIPESINKHYQSFQGVKAYLELELSQPGRPLHHSFAQLAYLAKEDMLYFKAFSQLTPHYFTLISKDRNFWLQIPKTKTVYTGPLEAIGQENFEMKITPQDFRRILVPNPIDQTPNNILIQDQGLQWGLILQGHVGTNVFKEREMWILKEGMKPIKDIRYSVNGSPYLEIQWENFEKSTAGKLYPRLITLFRPTTGYLLRLKIKKLETASNVPEELFEAPDLDSYQVVKISK